MAQVVVVGGGFAGLSAAARLAKLRHDVTLIEASGTLGGRLHRVTAGDAEFALSPESVTLPGVLRDLFRKSGRPMERVVDLVSLSAQRHIFSRDESVDLPFGNRADQHDAIVAGLGEDDWSAWVDRWPDAWDLLRRSWLDQVTEGNDVSRADRKALQANRSIQRQVKKQLKDPALAALVLDPFRLQGQDQRLVPATAGVRHYLERNFGHWGFDAGFPALAAALEQRLTERKVTVRLNTKAIELRTDGDLQKGGHVTGVETESGPFDAEVVVWCAAQWPAPLKPPSLNPAIPAARTFVTVGPDAPNLPTDVFVHTKPPVHMWTTGQGNWTLIHPAGVDVLLTLAHAGVDLRPHVVGAVRTLSPSDLVRLGHWGWQWLGWSSMDAMPGVGPRSDLYFAGAHAWPSGLLGGGSIEEIGMATAAIAERIGPASR